MYLEVSLPVADPADVEAATGAALGGGAELQRRPKPPRDVAEREGSLLLLAEDHPINRRVLVHQLGIIGFHVDTAEDGKQAFELFETGRYGLVLTDLNMPVMDGFELARSIRRREAEAGLSPTPIVALSANVVPEEAQRCAAAGMDDFTAKPASMPVLAGTLRRWLPHVDWQSRVPPGAGGPSAVLNTNRHDVVIDRSVLDELTGGDEDLAAAILGDFVESSASDLSALREALAGENADDVRRHAHRLAGASRMVGTLEVTRLGAQLEAAASTSVDDWHGLRSAMREIEAAVARVAAALSRPAVPR